MQKNYQTVPFSMNRRMVAASASIGRQRNVIHAITEVDITEVRRLIDENRQQTGKRLSLTAYVVACLSRAVAENPYINAFRRGRKLVLLNDVTVSVLMERNVSGEQVPEPLGIQVAQSKSFIQINDEIRSAQLTSGGKLGSLSGMQWINIIPGFLLKAFIRIASRSIKMNSRYGVVGVTAIGMFGTETLWFVPLSGATLTVTIGGIAKRDNLGSKTERLCLTLSFNHDIVDGAPAARFIKRLSEIITSAELLRNGAQVLTPANGA